MYAFLYVCMGVNMCVCVYVCVYVRTYVRMYVHTYVCRYLFMYCTYIRTYVRMYLCVCVCMLRSSDLHIFLLTKYKDISQSPADKAKSVSISRTTCSSFLCSFPSQWLLLFGMHACLSICCMCVCVCVSLRYVCFFFPYFPFLSSLFFYCFFVRHLSFQFILSYTL